MKGFDLTVQIPQCLEAVTSICRKQVKCAIFVFVNYGGHSFINVPQIHPVINVKKMTEKK